MNDKLNKTEVLRLETPVTTRKVPMTERGCDMLRAIRSYQETEYTKRRGGAEVVIPFPTAIHLLMQEFCKMKGINIENKKAD